MTEWVFLRHGQSFANAEGWLSGWDDVGLTPLGEEQARAAGVALRDVDIGRVLTSDLQRAWRTADLAVGERRPPLHRTGDLRERHMGRLQGLRRESMTEEYWSWLRSWEAGPPGGESLGRAVARALAVLRHWDDGTPTLVVAHGSLLRGVIGILDGIHPDEVARLPSAANAEPIRRRA